MSKFLATVLFSPTLFLSTPLTQTAFAQETPKGDDNAETVTVKSDRLYLNSEESKAYKIDNSQGATRMNISVKETPQTIHAVTRQQMDDFGLSNARDALAATPGVIVQSQETERSTFSSRGSEISNFQTDGLGIPLSDYNYQSGDIDTYIYDRIEVLKGANGLTSSLGDPGASVNFIRKRPTRELKYGVGLSYGSWDTSRVEGDVSGSVIESGRVRARLVGALQKGNSYLDHYSSQKGIISGVIEADLTDTTLFTVGHFEQDNRPEGNNWGALPLLDQDGNQISYARSYNPVPTWVKWDKTTKNSFAELKQKLGEDWEFKATYQFVKDDEDSSLVYYMGAPDAAGDGVSVYPSRYTTDATQKFLDVNVSGAYTLFDRKHELVVGTSWSKAETKERSFDADSVPTFNWNNWDGQFPEPDFTYSGDPGSGGDTKSEISSIYAATRIHATEDLKILIGANQAKASSAGNNYGSPVDYDKSKTIPYGGITYDLTSDLTSYVSYSTIYRPQSTLGTDGKVIQPVDGKAYEFGLKSSWFADRLQSGIAFFDTVQDHYPLRASDSTSIRKRYDVGKLKTQGYELSLSGEVAANTDLMVGWTHLRMKDLKSNDETRTYLPSRIANVLLSHRLAALPELRVGAGATYQSKTFQDMDSDASIGPVPVPFVKPIRQGEYTLLNLMAGYALTQNADIQLNVRNVANKKYLYSFPDGQGYYGAPANYTVSIGYKN